jgi:hypothetical protein
MSSRYVGPSHDRGVSIYVEASARVNVYALPADGLRAYEDGAINFDIFEVSRNRRIHNMVARPEPRRYWYLLIINDRVEPVNLYFEVAW